MTDRVFEPADANPFDQFDAGAEPAVGLPRTAHAQDEDQNPFDQFDPKPEVSSFGAFRRSAARSAFPALTSIPAMGAGAELGGAIGAPLGPIGAGAGAIIGGLGGAVAGGMAGQAAQHWFLSKLPDSWTDALGMSDRQEKLDQEQAPKASTLGGLAPYALTMKPGGFARKTLPENSTALERIMAHPATARVFGAGIMGGMELGQEAVQGEGPDWTKVAISTGFGLVFNKPTRIGEAISEIGARPVRRALGLSERTAPAPEVPPDQEKAAEAELPTEAAPVAAPAPTGIAPTLFHAPPARAEASTGAQPTIADGADLGVIGPSHTEATFQGTHEPDPVAVEAARETKRTEQSVIGPDPPPPDAHSLARQMHFDLFNEYDPLRERERALEGEPGAADHLAATRARLAELEEEVKAAYRRAAEAMGHPIHEASVEAPPIAPDIEAQKATIAEDVSTQLMAAGRPQEEAELAGKLIAARYEGRAGAFKGARGTPLELYRREGAEIRVREKTEEIDKKLAKAVNPATVARAKDQFTQRMAAGREREFRRRNEGGGGARVLSRREIEQRFAGTTEEEFNAARAEAEAKAPELKTMLDDKDWEFMASPEFYQRELLQHKTSPYVTNRLRRLVPKIMEELQSGPGNYVTIKSLRERIPQITDREIIGLADEGLLVLGRYGGPEEGAKGPPLVRDDRGNRYIGVALPRNEGKELFQAAPSEDATEGREFFQRRTAPPGPDLFTQREAEGQTNIPGTERISEADLAKRKGAEQVAQAFPEATINQRGDYVLPLAGGNGAVEFRVEPGTVVMSASYLDKAERGKGIASSAYRRIVDWALASGRDVRSHGAPQADARTLYESLAARGYQVERNKNLAGQTEYRITGGPLRRGVAQKPMDIGLFSDEAKQRELFQGKVAPETIRGAAYTVAGKTYEAPNHILAMDKAVEDLKLGGYDDLIDLQSGENLTDKLKSHRSAGDGFVTSTGRVVTRDEARVIAEGAGQGKATAERGIKAEDMLFQGARGKINLMEGRRPIITLMKDANASTFIHESGHQFLEEMIRDSQHELAPNQLRDDADTVLNWLGVRSAEDIKTREHEKFARGFEQYMREGHAPSPELASVFARFKQWLMNIYQTIKGLGKEISPDIRAVFDRMLTTEASTSAQPQRTVIAPERNLPRSLADIHETDAAFYADHEMEGVSDRIAAEADRAYGENPHAPGLETKIAAAEAAQPPGEARAGEPQGGEVHPGAGAAEPDTGRGGAGRVDETERAGGAEGVSEGAGLRGAEPDAGRERPESVPLAGRPAPDLTIGGQSFNVGKDGNVRAENITSREQLVAAINESSERIPGTGDRLTMGQMKGLADDLDIDPKQIDEAHLAATFGGLHNIASKIEVLRRTVVRQSETVFNAMRNVKDTGTDQSVAEFAKEAARLDMFMSVLSSVTTEMGRGLGMGFRNLEGWQKAADLNEFLKANTGKELFQLKMIAKLGSQLDSPAKVARFLRDAQNRSFGGMVLEYWINGLISGPATHATYAVGNAILTAEKLGPETAAAAMIGAARKAMGREGEAVRLGEVAAHFAGVYRGLPASLQAAAEGFRTGLTTLLPGEKARPPIPFTGDTGLVTARTIGNEPVSWGELGADLFGMVRGSLDGVVSGAALIKAGGEAGAPLVGWSHSPLGQIGDIAIRGVPAIPLGSAIRLPGRFIAAIHSFFRTTNYSAYRAGGAYRSATQAAEQAKAEGRAFSGHDFDAETARAWLNPSEPQMENYRHEATETSLMGQAGKFTENLQKLTNTEINLPVIGGIRLLKFVDPFVHISSNIIKQTVVERTPLGILSSELRADLAGKNGNIAQDTAMARMLVGTALSITFGGLAAQGYITGSGPKDPHEAAMWREVYQPHSVRIGDMWYQVNRLGPMGMLLGIAADLYEIAHDTTEGGLLKAAAHLQHAITQNILDESFMRGPADLIKAVEDPGRYGEGYIKNMGSSFVPFSVGMAQMARAADPYSRQARTVMDAIRAKIPGYSQTLLPRRNIWGDEVPNLPALGGRAVSALLEKQVNSDPVRQAMLDVNYFPAMPERNIRNVELTDQQYDDFARIAGRMAKQRLDLIVRSPDWRAWPSQVRHDVFAEVVRQTREGARGMIMMKFPQIPRDAAEALRKKKTGEK